MSTYQDACEIIQRSMIHHDSQRDDGRDQLETGESFHERRLRLSAAPIYTVTLTLKVSIQEIETIKWALKLRDGIPR